jgi:hypothetical protein
MSGTQVSEEQLVHLIRNALLVAGQEMGDGDHWPVIKDTVYKVMKDWEDLKLERNVREEMKKHIYTCLDDLDKLSLTTSAEDRANDAPILKELREIYDAYFEPIDMRQLMLAEEDVPMHVKRAEILISSLEHNHDA